MPLRNSGAPGTLKVLVIGRFLLILCLTLCMAQADAQVLPTAPAPDTAVPVLPEELSEEAILLLLSKASDSDVRELLLQQLRIRAKDEAPKSPFPGVVDIVRDVASGVLGGTEAALRQLPGLAPHFATLHDRFVKPRGAAGLLSLFGWLVATVVGGLLVEQLARWIVRHWRRRASGEGVEGFRAAVVSLAWRFARDAVGLVGFCLGAWIVIERLIPGDDLHRFVPDINRSFIDFLVFKVVVYTRVAAMVARFVLAPYERRRRLVHMGCADAKSLYWNIIIIGALWGMMGFFSPFFATHGVVPSEFRVQYWLQLLLYGAMAWTVWTARHALTDMLVGEQPQQRSRAERFIASVYPRFALVLIAATWIMVEYFHSRGWRELVDGRQNATLLILIFAPALDVAVRGLVRHLAPPMVGEGPLAESAHAMTLASYMRIGRAIVFGMVVLVVARMWGLTFIGIAEMGVGARAATNVVSIVLIAAIGYLVWETATLFINRRLAAEQSAAGVDINEEEPGGGEGGGTGGTRVATVLPLVRSVVQWTVIAVTALMMLGNVGIDTTPLLAGAGILGLAIGFGAQSLVADIVGGIFFLLDDAFRTGEYVEVEGTVGTVERISIRSMQLRHHRGAVHTIPYSQIPKITNYSRDWVIMKLRFTVPFETDPNKVKKIFKRIGAEMMDVPEFAADLIQPFKSQGVFDFDDVGMIIRGKFMARPGRQFTLRKEIYNRVQAAFAEAGIEFARREVRVAVPGLERGSELSDTEKSALAAAAAEVAQPVPPPA